MVNNYTLIITAKTGFVKYPFIASTDDIATALAMELLRDAATALDVDEVDLIRHKIHSADDHSILRMKTSDLIIVRAAEPETP